MTPFILCFEAHRSDGRVWALLRATEPDDDGSWEFYESIIVDGRLETVYRGPESAQPRAYLRGLADEFVVSHDGRSLNISWEERSVR